MKRIALALVLGFSAVAAADPADAQLGGIAGSMIESFTVTAPGVTISRDQQFVVTVKQKGKPAKTLTSNDTGSGVNLADGTSVFYKQWDGDSDVLLVVTSDGKELGKLRKTSMTLKLEGKKKSVHFNAKGALVGSAAKITVKPASLAEKQDALLIVAALLRDKV